MVKQRITEITNKLKDDFNEITNIEDKKFLLSLFSKHPDFENKLGDFHHVHVLYGKNKEFKGKTTNCFYLEQKSSPRLIFHLARIACGYFSFFNAAKCNCNIQQAG